MRHPIKKTSSIFLLLLLPLVLALMSCRTVYQAVGMLPTPTSPLPTPTNTPLPSATQTLTPQPTTPPVVNRITPFPERPRLTLEASKTPSTPDLQRRVFQQVWETVRDTYLYPDYNGLDWESVYHEYLAKIDAGVTQSEFYLLINEMIYALGDDHSFYLSPEQVQQENTEYLGGFNYVGIGVLITAVPEREQAVILSVFPGSPAEAAGLKPRDAILSVEGESILTAEGLLKTIIRGPEGTGVTITVQTPGDAPRRLTLVRSAISSHQPVPYTLLVSPQGKRVGYILLLSLSDSTIGDQFEQALRELSKEGLLDGLIIDNSQNGGGTDVVAKSILGFFTSGTLGYFVSHEGERSLEIHTSQDIYGSQQVPLVILVGPNTASFGEVISGVLQDTERAFLIGEITDGNVETLWGYDFEDGSRLWLAHESFRPLNNPEANWEENGIVPDLELPVQWDQFTVENDPLVQAALDYFDSLRP